MTLILSLRSIAIHLVAEFRSFVFTRHRLIQLKRHSYTHQRTNVRICSTSYITLRHMAMLKHWKGRMRKINASVDTQMFLPFDICFDSVDVCVCVWMCGSHFEWQTIEIEFLKSVLQNEKNIFFFIWIYFVVLYNEKHWYYLFLFFIKYFFYWKFKEILFLIKNADWSGQMFIQLIHFIILWMNNVHWT